jgi:Na+/H+ antiporter NhaC
MATSDRSPRTAFSSALATDVRSFVVFIIFGRKASSHSMEKQTQQREGHTSTERILRLFDLVKPHVIWTILVVIAIYSYFHTSNVIEFLILMAAAAGSLSLPQAINLLQGRSMPMRSSPLSKEQEANSQLEENAADKQDEQE